MVQPIRTIDLFSGAGGLTQGLHEASARFQPVLAVEQDHAAAASFKSNFPQTDVINCSIEQCLASGVHATGIDVVVGGPPCQGFSSLGYRNVDDLRNSLWEKYAEVIIRTKPRYFVIENVLQFRASRQFRELQRWLAPGGQLADYTIEGSHSVLNAAEYGAAQTRKRTVIIGRHRDLPLVGLPIATHSDLNSQRTVRKAIGDLNWPVERTELPARLTQFNGATLKGPFRGYELHLTRRYEEVSLRRIKSIGEEGNRFDIPEDLLPDCWRKHTSGSGDVMGRLAWDRPAVTIRTEFVKPEKGRYLHPIAHRALTLQEGARLQGFPDNFLWCGSKASIAKQIGNAVPIQLGKAIGNLLIGVC